MKEPTSKRKKPPLIFKERVLFSLQALIFISFGILTWTHTDLFKGYSLGGLWNRVFGTIAVLYGALSGLAASVPKDLLLHNKSLDGKAPPVPETEFTPENELERELLKQHQGSGMPFADFLKFMINQPILTLTQTVEMHEDTQKQPKMGEPLAVYDEQNQPYIASYSSMTRAKSKIEERPEYEYTVTQTCGELLSVLADGVGLMINPNNMKAGLKLTAIHAFQLKTLLSKKVATEEFLLTENFKPENELESALLNAQIENTPVMGFLKEIINQNVYVLTNKPKSIGPLIVLSKDDEKLAAYSSLSKAENKQKASPEYRYIEKRSIGSLLAWIPDGMGFIVNPNLKVCLTMYPESVQAVKPALKTD